MLKIFPSNSAPDPFFRSDENADVVEIHTQNHVIGISFCTVKTWRWIWSCETYSIDDEFNRVIEFELPTLGIMVCRN